MTALAIPPLSAPAVFGEPATTTRPDQGISNLPGSLELRDAARDPGHQQHVGHQRHVDQQHVDQQHVDQQHVDQQATTLMDEYRCTRSREVFDELIRLTRSQLMARVRSRARFLGKGVDPEELLQDAIINIYRYPDRFDASRPGAFRAWSSTIVDNSVRRYLRSRRSGVDLTFVPMEVLAQEQDRVGDPGQRAAQQEVSRQLAGTFGIFLMLYLRAYESLSERERFVLHMVEVNGMRYADLAEIMTLRPEALKMVVFRARQRIMRRVARAVAVN